MMQVGSGSCCCCCLHWIGAAAGAAVGIVGPLRADKRKRTPPVHPIARKYVVRATWISIVVVAVVTIPTGAGFALVFLPSLALLPVGAGAMLGAALARKTEAWRIAAPEERQRIGAGMGLAWRIAWKSFVWATFASGIGYLLMFLIGLAFDAF